MTWNKDPCYICGGMKFLPNFMDAPGHPRCACGADSVDENGHCRDSHNPVPCPRCGDVALLLNSKYNQYKIEK